MGEEAGIKSWTASPNGSLRESGTRRQRSRSLVREGEVVHSKALYRWHTYTGGWCIMADQPGLQMAGVHPLLVMSAFLTWCLCERVSLSSVSSRVPRVE